MVASATRPGKIRRILITAMLLGDDVFDVKHRIQEDQSPDRRLARTCRRFPTLTLLEYLEGATIERLIAMPRSCDSFSRSY